MLREAERNATKFGPPGTLYVYFVYGMHWMLNVVTGPIDYPAAVLIRAVEGINGPARLTNAMRVTGTLNGKPASKENGVWFSEGTNLPRKAIARSARIGVGYAGEVWSQNIVLDSHPMVEPVVHFQHIHQPLLTTNRSICMDRRTLTEASHSHYDLQS